MQLPGLLTVTLFLLLFFDIWANVQQLKANLDTQHVANHQSEIWRHFSIWPLLAATCRRGDPETDSHRGDPHCSGKFHIDRSRMMPKLSCK